MEAVFKIRVNENIKVYNISIYLCQKGILIKTLFKFFLALAIFFKDIIKFYVKDYQMYIDQLFPFS